jgi:hypothetical protein
MNVLTLGTIRGIAVWEGSQDDLILLVFLVSGLCFLLSGMCGMELLRWFRGKKRS